MMNDFGQTVHKHIFNLVGRKEISIFKRFICIRWQEAINDCSEALKRNPYNLKALFRRGKAYEQQGDIKAAREGQKIQNEWK